jgi:hypothetical protein
MSIVSNILHPASLSTIFANIAFFVTFQCIFFYLVVSKKYEETLTDKAGIIKPYVENSPYLGKLLCKNLLRDAVKNSQRYEGIRWVLISDNKSRSDIIEDDAFSERLNNELERRKAYIKKNIDNIDQKLKEEQDSAKIEELKNSKKWWQEDEKKEGISEQLKLYSIHKYIDDTYKIGNIVKSKDKYYECISIRQAKDILNRYDLVRAMALFVIPSVVISVVLIVLSVYQKKWEKHHSLALILIAGCFSTEFIFYLTVLQGHLIVGDWELIYNFFKSS